MTRDTLIKRYPEILKEIAEDYCNFYLGADKNQDSFYDYIKYKPSIEPVKDNIPKVVKEWHPFIKKENVGFRVLSFLTQTGQLVVYHNNEYRLGGANGPALTTAAYHFMLDQCTVTSVIRHKDNAKFKLGDWIKIYGARVKIHSIRVINDECVVFYITEPFAISRPCDRILLNNVIKVV